MTQTSNQPDWQARLPGEQWVLLDSTQAADAYLATYKNNQVIKEAFPNEEGLYARIQFPDRILQHRIYVVANSDDA